MKYSCCNKNLLAIISLTIVLGGCGKLEGVSIESAKQTVAQQSTKIAEQAVAKYGGATETALAEMVRFKTFAKDGIAVPDDPEFVGFKNYLKTSALQLGLSYRDHGYMIIITLKGEGNPKKPNSRLGIVTHGDVVPADASKWRADPFTLDIDSQPGALVARGTEDDKGPIATALYAMKAIADSGIKLTRTIELYVYLAEESDWAPLHEFLVSHTMPTMNITIDASYPLVVAEKGWSQIIISFDDASMRDTIDTAIPRIVSFDGGVFASQIPEDAHVIITDINANEIARLKQRAANYELVQFSFVEQGDHWRISSKGRAAHSSQPENGINGIAYLSNLLADISKPSSAGGAAVKFINDNIGLEHFAGQFGDIAYSHEFMGPMTLAPTVVNSTDGKTTLTINLRRPAGKDAQQLRQEIEALVASWSPRVAPVDKLEITIGEPMLVSNAPHAATLLAIFQRFTGMIDPQPVSIGGSTNAKLLPSAVSFGPSMPGVEYTGHSEHEFITRQQLLLNLKMYTAMMIETGNLD